MSILGALLVLLVCIALAAVSLLLLAVIGAGFAGLRAAGCFPLIWLFVRLSVALGLAIALVFLLASWMAS